MAEVLKFVIEVAGEKAEAAVDSFKEKLHGVGEESKDVSGVTATQMATAGTAILAVGTAIGATMLAAAEHAAHLGDELHDLAQRTGITVEQLSALKFAAEQSGASIDDIATSTRILARNVYEAAAGADRQSAVFQGLGVSIKDAAGNLRPMNDILLDVADRFSTMQDGAGKAALAQEIFGRGAQALIPLLNEGSEGIGKMTAQLDAVGGIMSTKAAAAADQYKDAENLLAKSVEGLTISIGTALIPALTTAVELMTAGMAAVTGFANAHPEAIRLVLALAGALVGSGGLLIGLAGLQAAIPLITKALAGLAASGGALALTVTGFAALGAVVYTFRTEIASGFLKSLSFMLDGLASVTGAVGQLADKLGIDWLSGKLRDAMKWIQDSRDSVMGMALEFDHATGEVIGNTAAVDALLEKHKEIPPVLDLTGEAAKKMAEAQKKASDDQYQAVKQALADIQKSTETFLKWESDNYDDALKKKIALSDAHLKAYDVAFAARKKIDEQEQADFRSRLEWESDQYSKALDVQAKLKAEQLATIKKGEEENAKFIEQNVKDVREATGKILDDIFKKGSDVFTDLAKAIKQTPLSLGKAILEDITGALVGPVKAAFSDFFQGVISGMLKNFGKELGEAVSYGLKGGSYGSGHGVMGTITSILSSIIGFFDEGTPFVPRTGLAVIHKGEAVIPADYNMYNSAARSASNASAPWSAGTGGGGDNGLLTQILYELRSSRGQPIILDGKLVSRALAPRLQRLTRNEKMFLGGSR
jgi:TP901 family phage tail tape measure protein